MAGTKDEHDAFGALVAQIMKKLPEEKIDDLRLEILTLLKNAKN